MRNFLNTSIAEVSQKQMHTTLRDLQLDCRSLSPQQRQTSLQRQSCSRNAAREMRPTRVARTARLTCREKIVILAADDRKKMSLARFLFLSAGELVRVGAALTRSE